MKYRKMEIEKNIMKTNYENYKALPGPFTGNSSIKNGLYQA